MHDPVTQTYEGQKAGRLFPSKHSRSSASAPTGQESRGDSSRGRGCLSPDRGFHPFPSRGPRKPVTKTLQCAGKWILCQSDHLRSLAPDSCCCGAGCRPAFRCRSRGRRSVPRTEQSAVARCKSSRAAWTRGSASPGARWEGRFWTPPQAPTQTHQIRLCLFIRSPKYVCVCTPGFEERPSRKPHSALTAVHTLAEDRALPVAWLPRFRAVRELSPPLPWLSESCGDRLCPPEGSSPRPAPPRDSWPTVRGADGSPAQAWLPGHQMGTCAV